jgi:hypothetical protein
MNAEPGISYADLIEFFQHRAVNATGISQELRGVFYSLAVEFSCIRAAIMSKTLDKKPEPPAEDPRQTRERP